MAERGMSFNGVAACGVTPSFETSEAAFNAALLREQYRSLARLGPYVHGVVILTALALFGVTAPTGSLVNGVLLPAALIAVSLYRLKSWFKARASVELEALDLVERRVRAASLVGPALTFAFALTTAIATWGDGLLEFALALVAVWGVAAVCAFCLNMLANEASIIVVAATVPLVVAFLARGAELTLSLAVLVAIATCFVIRMLEENFRMFAEIVRSRFVIAEKQRVAEEAQKAAMTIAMTDDLTGLPNRRCFQTLLADRMANGITPAQPFALGLIDLDGFKPINDAHGHPVGDEVLKQVAHRLAKAMDGRGSAVRMGGDEFAILCDGIDTRDGADALGDQMRALFATPFVVHSLSIPLTSACGFALFPLSAAEPSELVRLADAALYRAKAIGPGNAAVLDPKAGRSPAFGTASEEAFDRAAELDGVSCKPFVAFTTDRIRGSEQALRLHDFLLTPIASPAFIRIPERIRVIG